MNWNNCISSKRTGSNKITKSTRSDFQRDYDRIIFSSAFRRLQDKTQVFPLPGNTFVHNRLNHSLEVSSVGRSLGHIIGLYISENTLGLTEDSKSFYKYDLSSVIAAGCLAHDIGNPPFGHSGESAISSYFIKNALTRFNDNTLKSYFSNLEWNDLTNFEGNANALNIVSNNYPGKSKGGLSLTYSTLASILKYPCNSSEIDKSKKHLKKYGYFQKDYSVFKDICVDTNMIPGLGKTFSRHPFVYLVEAADDICYRIIDIEDAHRINILSTEFVKDLFIRIITEVDKTLVSSISTTLDKVTDENEQISYLRAKTINALISRSTEVFINNMNSIIEGSWNDTLFDSIEQQSNSLKEAKMLSIEKIYNHRSVIEIELTGYNIINTLLSQFIPLVLNSNLSSLEKKTLLLIPDQFKYDDSSSKYLKTIGILDYISGMTDGYATELYQKLTGIYISSYK